MSVVDLHPEELLDKLARGALTPAEHERLNAHLASCQVCRFELAVRADVEREVRAGASGGQTAPPEPQRVPSEAPASSVVRSAKTRSKLRRWTTAWGVAAALLAFAAVSLASYAVRGAWPWTIPAPPKEGDRAAAAASTRPTARLRPRPSDTAFGRAAVSEPASAETPISPHETTPATAEPAPAKASAGVVPPPRTEGAAELFAEANRARRAGDTTRALSLYRRLERRFPASEESVLSNLIVGRLLLNSNPAGALAEFDAYLASGRSGLAAEASVGRARALALLGRQAESRAAWREVLARFPRSTYAAEAKATLGSADSP